MMTRRALSIMRLFSTISTLQKKAPSNISNEEISRAISLLSNKDSFNVVTETEKNKLINQFTSALNTDIKNKEVNLSSVNTHFNQSILGLNELLSSTVSTRTSSLSKDISKLDSISIKEVISKCKSEEELLQTFDHFVHNDMMSLNNFRLFLLNKNLINLGHIVKKFKFMDPSNDQFLKHKLLLATKALMLKNQKVGIDLYEENIGLWLRLLKSKNMSKLLEKSLYQVHYKITRDLKMLISLEHTPSSYISLVETLPRQLDVLREIANSNGLVLTRNQQYFVELVDILNNEKDSGSALRSALKLSVDNRVHSERVCDEDVVTVQKCRFVAGVVEIADGLGRSARGLVERASRDSAGTVYAETVLRFV